MAEKQTSMLRVQEESAIFKGIKTVACGVDRPQRENVTAKAPEPHRKDSPIRFAGIFSLLWYIPHCI